jgi:hypothetical protein
MACDISLLRESKKAVLYSYEREKERISRMASLDKQSLREQFDKLKSDFSALSRKGKMGADSIALVNGLILHDGTHAGYLP